MKRKRKRDEAKERKRLLKEKEGGEVGQTSSSNDANDSDKQRRKRAKLSESNSTSKASSSITDVDDQPGDTTTTTKDDEEEEEEAALHQSIAQLQTTWSISTSVTLHTTLATGLHNLQYTFPTPIQSATLPASILGRRDIVGAAPTGSGKTLSFGLPILQYLLETCCATDGRRRGVVQLQLPLQALILTPTRELALQVTCELQKVSLNTIKIGTIVGGFAEVKQRRTLEKVKPPILVATPGRLWELVRSCLSVVL